MLILRNILFGRSNNFSEKINEDKIFLLRRKLGRKKIIGDFFNVKN
jgi:hypothetical protein